MSDEEQNVSDLYAKHQQLFDDRFAEIMIRTFVGFERSKFDALADNDIFEQEESEVQINIKWFEDNNEDDFDDWEEGDIQFFSDGIPALDPEDEL